MGQEDRLKREIDLIGKVLAKIAGELMGAKNTLSFDESLKNVQETLQEQAGIDLAGLVKSSEDEFAKQISEKKLSNVHLEELAHIFYELGETAPKVEDAEQYYQKALILYEQISVSGTSFSLERYYRIEKIKKNI